MKILTERRNSFKNILVRGTRPECSHRIGRWCRSTCATSSSELHVVHGPFSTNVSFDLNTKLLPGINSSLPDDTHNIYISTEHGYLSRDCVEFYTRFPFSPVRVPSFISPSTSTKTYRIRFNSAQLFPISSSI